MARNEEKHFGKLNRLYLMKEKEEHEKKHPQRPRLDTLYTPEEIQKWLPSIKRDLDFYLKKSQVVCYSDAHIDDCKEKVIKLEKEFKAFVRKIKQLSPSPLEVTPWTSRPYKRKKISAELPENAFSKKFVPIKTPILDHMNRNLNVEHFQDVVNMDMMDKPLSFVSEPIKCEHKSSQLSPNIRQTNLQINASHSWSSISSKNSHDSDNTSFSEMTKLKEINNNLTNRRDTKENGAPSNISIVNYDSSGNESS